MQNLHNYLPKDLVNIVEEYSKDRTNFDKVLKQLVRLNTEIMYAINDDNRNYLTILNVERRANIRNITAVKRFIVNYCKTFVCNYYPLIKFLINKRLIKMYKIKTT